MPHSFIQNYRSLAVTEQRRQALDIINAGLTAAETGSALHANIKLEKNILTVKSDQYDLDRFKRIFVVSVGKAAVSAARTLEKILEDRISDGIVLDTRTDSFSHMRSFKGSHPYPSSANQEATEHIWRMVNNCTEQDLVLTVISGGGSALLFRPHHLSSDQVREITKSMFKQAADIHEINTIRKHLSTIKGGQLAAHAQPATVIGLIFSDIMDNELSMVASGPTYLDPTSSSDAWKLIQKYRLDQEFHLKQSNLIETPKDQSFFANVHNYLMVNNQVAANAMLETAANLGFQAKIHSLQITGEARQVGANLAQLPMPPGTALIAAGETTVTITGNGTGGRNLELSLGALAHLPANTLVISCASDGIDNAMPAAGAIADEISLKSARSGRLNPTQYLDNNDSYAFFEKTDQLIVTGPTGINIADLILVLKS